MSYYESVSAEQKELDEFPPLDIDECLRQTNALFEPYIFVQNTDGGKMIWTSCCNRHEYWPDIPRTCTPAHLSVWWGAHNYEAICPFCGKTVKIKETRYIRLRNKLEAYEPVMFISEKDGNIYARGYWARKIYEGDYAAPPKFLIRYAYKFAPGEVTEWTWGNCGGTYKRVIHPGYAPNEGPRECFYGRNGAKEAYSVFGAEAIENSFLKYCCAELWRDGWEYSYSLMRYLCLASMHPRQVEMLMKTGHRELVSDYVLGRKKNARVIDWTESNMLKAFGLSKKEWNELEASGADIRLVEYYKSLRKAKLDTSFEVLKKIDDERLDTALVVRLCKKHRVKPKKLLGYLDKFTGPRCHGGYFGLRSAFRLWKDYLDMAAYLEMDLREHNNLFPKNLELAHNEAATEQQRLLQIEEDRKNAEKAAEHARLLEERRLKYNFANETHFIRIAETKQEVITEGKTLEHCVGGYAGRHMDGTRTILFLRRIDAPEASLYTIEMHGNQLIQIHGFKNEVRNGVRIAPDPREVMKEMLDTWLDWLERGSPRAKDGTPKLRKKKKETNAA